MSIGDRVQAVLNDAGVQPSELRSKAKLGQALAVLDGTHCDCKPAIRARIVALHQGKAPASQLAVAA